MAPSFLNSVNRFVFLCLSTLFSVVLWGWFILNQPLRLPNEGLVYYVAPGTSLSKVVDALLENQLLTSKTYFLFYAFITQRLHTIKYGEYYCEPGMTLLQLLDKLSRGLVLQRRLTLIEGYSIQQVLKAIQSAPYLTEPFFSVPYPNLEGLFFPNTYFYTRGMSAMQVLKRAQNLMQQYLETHWKMRDTDLPFATPYEALILASIVEKEVKVATERPLVAGVFVKRLKLGMKLQADPTVIYGLGESLQGQLKREHLLWNTPYNTYIHHGLPPTPIALPSAKSIDAVLHPAQTSFLYFVAKGDGTHYFSEKLTEHLAAVKRYRQTAPK